MEENIVEVRHPKVVKNRLAMCALLVALVPGYIQGNRKPVERRVSMGWM